MNLSEEARSTPVMLVGDVDLSASAYRRLEQEWERMGRKYGFVTKTAAPHDEAKRQIRAEPAMAAEER